MATKFLATKTGVSKFGTLSASQKVQLKVFKSLSGLLKSAGDAADMNASLDTVRTILDTLQQRGDMVGKRISGSESHDTADQAVALVTIVTEGNIPKIG